jgi:hypothetical protein
MMYALHVSEHKTSALLAPVQNTVRHSERYCIITTRLTFNFGCSLNVMGMPDIIMIINYFIPLA